MGREDNLPPMNADKFFVRSALIGVHRWQIVLRSVFDRLSGKGRLKPVFNLPDESEGSGSLTLLGKAPSVISLTSMAEPREGAAPTRLPIFGFLFRPWSIWARGCVSVPLR